MKQEKRNMEVKRAGASAGENENENNDMGPAYNSGQWSMSMISCGLSFVCVILMIKLVLSKGLTQTTVTKKKKKKQQPPGPWGWPIVGNLFQLGPEPYKDFMRLHEKYGPLVKLKLGDVNIVTTFTPELIREMICNQDEIFANRPQTIGVEHLAYGGRDVALAPYGPHWKNMRRICMEYLLTTRRLESYQKHRAEEAKFMVHQVMARVKEGKAVMVRDVLGGFSMNVMTQMLLSKRFFGSKDAGPEQSAEFLHITHQVFWLLGLFNIADYLPSLRWFDLQGYERLMQQVAKRMDAFHSTILEEHRLEHERRGNWPRDRPDDFVDILLTLPGHNGEEHLDDIEMKALIQDMIAAAIDTSSVTSEWAMSELVRNPDILKRAQEEVDTVVGNRNVEEADLVHLRYLRSIVKETFRLHPPGPFLIIHEALKDTEVAGYYIPKKTQLFVNTYALGRSPDIWKEKIEEFWPDRWMEEKVDIRDEKLRIIPFSAGRRRCPGAPLGQCMVLLALATLIHSFHWSLPPPLNPQDLNMREAFGLTLPRAEPLVAMATPRLPALEEHAVYQ